MNVIRRTRAWVVTGVLVSLFFSLSGLAYAAPIVPAGFQVNTIVSGLSLPTSFVFAPDGRIFITEKGGTVRIFKNGQLLATPVIRLPDINDFGDRGLESIALDPDFAHNGYMYLAYTYENTPGQNYTGPKTGRIVRFTVIGDSADFNSRAVILGTVGGDTAHPSCNNFAVTSDCILSNASTHSMGDMHFGSDGKLYATLGDGAGYDAVDPVALAALDTRALAGKIIRINTDGTGPSDNPFYTGNPNDNQSKVWTTGHRNSYRFSFRPTDGKIFFGEVGWSMWEEINIGTKGASYGWPCREGLVATAYNCTPPTAWTDPIYVFDHHTSTASAIGGIFPGTGAYPAQYTGNYFFGDYSNDVIKRMVLGANDSVTSVEDFITGAGGPVNFAPGPDGSIYYAAINVGQIRRIVFSTANRPPIARASANPVTGLPPLTVHFSGTLSSDPDNDPITYSWNFGDGSTASSAASPDHLYSALGNYTAALTVTDSHGTSNTATVGIIVTNNPATDPIPHVIQTTGAPVPPNVIGRDVLVTTTVHNTGAAVPFIIDIEIYDANGNQVAQRIYDNQTIPTNSQADYALNWFPGTIGEYTVKVGLFKTGWSGMYEWNNEALKLHILDRGATALALTHQGTALASANPVVGSSDLITTTIANSGGAGNALIDVEVYNGTTKVSQQFFDNETFAANQSRNFSHTFTPTVSGTYKVSVGIFQPGWTGLYGWFDNVAIIQAGAAPSTIPFYLDALAPGVENWSWNSTLNFSDATLVNQGATSLRITYNTSWAGAYLHRITDTIGKNSLAFAIAGNGSSGQNIQVFAYDAAGNALAVKNLSAYVTGGITNGVWKQVMIPLADLGAQNKSILGFSLQDVSGVGGASINLDNVRIQ